MKNYIGIFFLALVSLVACQQKNSNTAENETKTYACPMKCEGEKIYAEPGKCPVCGMNLEPVFGALAPAEYVMNLTTLPADVEAAKPAKLMFRPAIKGNDTLQVPLDVVHEKKMHVILVSKDLGSYQHLHPEYQADGNYVIDYTFSYGGEYIVFADYHPTGAEAQVERRTILVTGLVKPKETFTTQSLVSETAGFTVTLKPQGGKFLTNNVNHIGIAVLENGEPVTNFESVMGAKGHLVIISGDGQKYVHVHGEEVEGMLDFHAQFDQPGIHRAFFQFQTNGKLHTSYFTLDVKEGKPGEVETHDHEHGEEHDHDHGHDHNHGDTEHKHQ